MARVRLIDRVRITNDGITHGDKEVSWDHVKFARSDGFLSWPEMREWFRVTHGLPFDGVAIFWDEPIQPPSEDFFGGALVMDWFQQQRIEWIMEMMFVYGFIDNQHLVRKFGISEPEAANDFRVFQERHPGKMKYDAQANRYVSPDPV